MYAVSLWAWETRYIMKGRWKEDKKETPWFWFRDVVRFSIYDHLVKGNWYAQQ